MESEVLRRVAEMLRSPGAVTRNRNLLEFENEAGQRAWRCYRLFLSLMAELERAAQSPEVRVSVQESEAGLQLVLVDPRVSYRRSCLVPPELVELFKDKLAALGLLGEDRT